MTEVLFSEGFESGTLDDLYMEAAERMMVGMEVQATSAHVATEHNVRVTRFASGFLYQSLGASTNAITRERAVELLAKGKADAAAFADKEIGNARHRE